MPRPRQHRGFTLALVVAAAVLVCVVLAPSLSFASPPPSRPSIGPVIAIDFGSTNSRAAIVKDGRVQIIANDQGSRITPSYVAFTDTERLIGDAAKNQAANNPENTIFDVKRLIGRLTSDTNVQKDTKLFPFHITDNDGWVAIQAQVDDKPKQFSPEEISAMILTKMNEVAEAFLGKEIKNAIVTFPAYFNDAQRQALKDAGTIAGLNVMRIIKEPTAAAIAYGLDKDNKEKNILVYDLGSKSFDVSVLFFEDGVFDLWAFEGDTHLGGADFSQRLLQHFIASIKQKHGIDLTFDHSQLLSALRREVENAKHLLSTASEAQVTLTLSDDAVFSEMITRAEFEELTADLVLRTLAPITKALHSAGMNASSITDLVVIGGASRMPRVHQLLSELFPVSSMRTRADARPAISARLTLRAHSDGCRCVSFYSDQGKEALGGVEPDEAIALGAGIYAQLFDHPEPVNFWPPEHLLVSLGIRTVGGAFTRVVPRGTIIPTKKSLSLTCRDNEESVHIEVYQGERALAQENRLLGRLELTGLPPATLGQLAIEVTFEIDPSGDLHVTLEDTTSSGGKRETLQIPPPRWLPEQEEIERIIAAGEEFAEADKTILASTDGHEHPGCVAVRTPSPDTDDGGHHDEL